MTFHFSRLLSSAVVSGENGGQPCTSNWVRSFTQKRNHSLQHRAGRFQCRHSTALQTLGRRVALYFGISGCPTAGHVKTEPCALQVVSASLILHGMVSLDYTHVALSIQTPAGTDIRNHCFCELLGRIRAGPYVRLRGGCSPVATPPGVSRSCLPRVWVFPRRRIHPNSPLREADQPLQSSFCLGVAKMSQCGILLTCPGRLQSEPDKSPRRDTSPSPGALFWGVSIIA